MDRGMVADVKASVRSILITTKDSVSVLDLEKDYKRYAGLPLPYTALGFNSAEQFLRSIPDVVTLTGYGPQALVQYVPHRKSAHVAALVKDQKTNENSRRRTKTRHQRYRTYNFPLSDDEGLDAFKRLSINRAKVSPRRRNWGPPMSFSSSNESEEKSPKHVENVSTCNINKRGRSPTTAPEAQTNEPINNHDEILRREEAINKRFELLFNSTRDSDTPDVDPLSTKSRNAILFGTRVYPINARRTREGVATEGIDSIGSPTQKMMQKKVMTCLEIPQCDLYEKLEKGSIFSLYISEINSALKFYFHIFKENHELLQLEAQMKQMYSSLSVGELLLPDSYLQPGKYCAVNKDNTWYRAKILEVSPYLNDFRKAKIFFLDFGCTCESVSVKKLKLLAPIFYQLPEQAALARLSRIKSNELARSTATKKYFESLGYGRCLYAYVKNVDTEMRCFDLILLDTNKDPKCNINDALIEKNLAERE